MEHTCQQIRDVLDSFLSDELLVDTNHVVLRHLRLCSSCVGELERRAKLRQALSQALTMDIPTEELERRIMSHILSRRPWWSRLHDRRLWIGVAALLVVWALWPRGRQSTAPPLSEVTAVQVDATAFLDTVINHRECALPFPAGTTMDPSRARSRLDPPYEGLLTTIDSVQDEYELVDAHLCQYQSRTFGHVVLETKGRRLSLLVTPRTRGGLPISTTAQTPVESDFTLHEVQALGFEAAALEHDRFFVFVVSDLSREENTRWAEALAPAAVRVLQAVER